MKSNSDRRLRLRLRLWLALASLLLLSTGPALAVPPEGPAAPAGPAPGDVKSPQGTTLARLSFWIPEPRRAEFAAEFEQGMGPWLAQVGLERYRGPAPDPRPGIYTRVYAFDSPKAFREVIRDRSRELEVLRYLQDFGERYGSQQDDGLLRARFNLYQTPLDELPTVPAGPGRPADLGPGRGRWRTYDVTDGLAGPMILCLFQDRDGVMWFGTRNNGVSRFDGQRWVSFNTDDGLPSNQVNQITQDDEGRIWVASRKGIVRIADGQVLPYALPDGEVLTESVNAMLHGPDGLWLAVHGRGLAHVRAGTVRWYDHDTGLIDNRINDILRTEAGEIWVTSHSGISRFDGTAWTSLADPEQIPGGYPVGMRQLSDGSLWLLFGGMTSGPPGGLARREGDGWATLEPEISQLLAKPIDIHEDADGTVWVSTFEGVVRRRDGVWEEFQPGEGRTLKTVYQILRDREGFLWFASGVGAWRYDDRSLTVYTESDGVPHGVWSLRRDSRDDLWIAHGGRGRGVTRLRDGSLTTFTEADGLPDNRVFASIEDDRGRTWLSTGQGAARYDEAANTWSILGPDEGLPGSHTSGTAEDDEGALWIATPRGLARWDGERVRVFGAEDGLPATEVGGVYRTRDGSIWALCQDGVARWDGEAFTSYGLEEGLANPELFDLAEDTQGRLWIATHGGVSVFDDGQFTNYTADDGLASNDVHSVAFSGDQVWFGTDGGGISVFDGRVFQSITAGDGLPDNAALGVEPAGDGSFWVGTASGLVRYRPRPVEDVPVRIDAVVADRRYDGEAGAVEVPSTVEVVAFEFGAVSLKTQPGQMVYCYRLAGHEDDWQHTQATRVDYQGLPRGDYVFEVQAVDRDMSYSAAPARARLAVHLPYERFAWIGLLGLSVLLVGWQGMRVVRRDQRLTESNRELEEKTRALELAHHEVLQASQAKSAFLANVSHELRTPLNAIINFSSLILDRVYGDVSDDLRDAVEEIDRNGDNLLTLINDVLDLSKIEAGAMKLQYSECTPSACVETAVTAMGHRARNKGLTLEGEVRGEVPSLWADERRLTQQVLVNLVDNAIKFTETGGVRVGAGADNGDVHFWVADTGPGIDAREQERVFQPFYQADGSTTRANGGTGLGLAIVRRFVELHGGAVWLEAEAGKGSTFHVRIPRRQPPTATS